MLLCSHQGCFYISRFLGHGGDFVVTDLCVGIVGSMDAGDMFLEGAGAVSF